MAPSLSDMLMGEVAEALYAVSCAISDAIGLPVIADEDGPLAREMFPHLCYRVTFTWNCPTVVVGDNAWLGVCEFDVVSAPDEGGAMSELAAEQIQRIVMGMPKHILGDGSSLEIVDTGIQSRIASKWSDRTRVIAGMLVRSASSQGVAATLSVSGSRTPAPHRLVRSRFSP